MNLSSIQNFPATDPTTNLSSISNFKKIFSRSQKLFRDFISDAQDSFSLH